MLIFHYSEFHVSLFHDHQVNDGNKEQGHNITRKFCYLFACYHCNMTNVATATKYKNIKSLHLLLF